MSEKTIFQIIIGEIPKNIQLDIESVRDWCEYKNYKYKLITELPEDLVVEGLSPRIASDYLRIKILSEHPFHCWTDWDVRVNKEFDLKDKPILVPFFDWFIYNADRTDVFQQVYETMLSRKSEGKLNWLNEEGTIYKAFRTVAFERDWMMLEVDKYLIHHCHSRVNK